jgi:hypothetical protein
MQARNCCSDIFTFIDSGALVSKLSLWEERDKAITAGYERLNNMVLPKISSDPQARIGAKSAKKFWYGFKKHVAVDMQSGMITKVAVLNSFVANYDLVVNSAICCCHAVRLLGYCLYTMRHQR